MSELTAKAQALVTAMAEGDFATLRAGISPAMRMHPPQSSAKAGFPTLLTNSDDFIAAIRGSHESHYKQLSVQFEEAVEQGSKVALMYQLHGSTHSGKEYHNRYHALMIFKDGVLAEYFEGTDTAYAFTTL